VIPTVLVPAAVIGATLVAFNVARFGSPVELGESYQLLGVTPKDYPYNHLAYMPQGILTYLFAVPRVIGHFPWFALRRGGWDFELPISYANEPGAGYLVSSPFVLVFGASFVVFWRVVSRRSRTLLFVVVCAALYAMISLALLSFRFPGTTMRYELDFAPWLMVVALVTFLCLLAEKNGQGRRGLLVRVAVGTALVGAIVNLAFGLDYTEGEIHAGRPRAPAELSATTCPRSAADHLGAGCAIRT
jgi:hypothetical protein